jgi:hypothetical protein
MKCASLLDVDSFNPGSAPFVDLLRNSAGFIFLSVKLLFWRRSMDAGCSEQSKHLVNIDDGIALSLKVCAYIPFFG